MQRLTEREKAQKMRSNYDGLLAKGFPRVRAYDIYLKLFEFEEAEELLFERLGTYPNKTDAAYYKVAHDNLTLRQKVDELKIMVRVMLEDIKYHTSAIVRPVEPSTYKGVEIDKLLSDSLDEHESMKIEELKRMYIGGDK